MNYEELVKRNFPLISRETQEKIRKLKVAIVGVGALSFVPAMLARLGGENFVLIDGDIIEAHNMNHQIYTVHHIGKPKVEALKEIILSINPQANVIALSSFVTLENLEEIWEKYLSTARVIVDGIDPVTPLGGILISLELARKAKENEIVFLYPLDIGHGAILLTQLDELSLKGEEPLEILLNLMQKAQQFINFPQDYEEIIMKTLKEEIHYPQTILSAISASILVTTCILNLVQGKSLPKLLYLDLANLCFIHK